MRFLAGSILLLAAGSAHADDRPQPSVVDVTTQVHSQSKLLVNTVVTDQDDGLNFVTGNSFPSQASAFSSVEDAFIRVSSSIQVGVDQISDNKYTFDLDGYIQWENFGQPAPLSNMYTSSVYSKTSFNISSELGFNIFLQTEDNFRPDIEVCANSTCTTYGWTYSDLWIHAPAGDNITVTIESPEFPSSPRYLDRFWVAGVGGLTANSKNPFAMGLTLQFMSVPEPATWALLAASFFGIGAIHRRKRRFTELRAV